MAQTISRQIELVELKPRVSEWRRIINVISSRKIVIFGLVVVGLTVIAAIFAPLLTPYKPNETNMTEVLKPPSSAHLLGTDEVGRDLLTRIIYGTRVSFTIGIAVVSLAGVIGMALGLIAGYFGGVSNTLIMRSIDALMSFPPLLLAIVIASVLGIGTRNVIIALGVSFIPAYARLMFAQVLSVKQNEYITAGRSLGAGDWYIMWRHVLPNCLPPLLVQITLMMGLAILSEAGLSFLGLGVEPPTPAWGAMVSEGRRYLLKQPFVSLAPGFVVMLVVFSFNMIGDGLRDALDPRLRGTF
jgi:peptide/nickel transport system permease protein